MIRRPLAVLGNSLVIFVCGAPWRPQPSRDALGFPFVRDAPFALPLFLRPVLRAKLFFPEVLKELARGHRLLRRRNGAGAAIAFPVLGWPLGRRQLQAATEGCASVRNTP